MAITALPTDSSITRSLECSICCVRLLFRNATAGFFDADNHQAFACVSHFSEVDLLIRGWADFLKRERQRYKHRVKETDANVWLDS